MGLQDRVKEAALSRAEGVNVVDVRIGLGYTAVLLDNGCAGVAYTFLDEAKGGCSVYRNIRPLASRPAVDLLHLFDTGGRIEAALALATANALFNRPDRDYRRGDILEQLPIGPEDRVGMVGHFGPLVPAIRKQAKALYIFEQIDLPQGNLLPVSKAEHLLPQCQIALLTSTAIINQTADHLLALTTGCREIVFLGASTPLIPEVFEGTRVTQLSGVTVVDPAAIVQIVSEGGGMRFFKSSIEKVNLPLSARTHEPEARFR
jgi:uncharacterized protein (DUF4213/DUF364 family)